MKLHHIGIICRNMERSNGIYRLMGYEIETTPVVDSEQHNKLLFLRNKDGILMELIEPLDGKSSVKNCNEGYHHICYETGNMDVAIKEITEKRLGAVFTKPTPALAFNNRRIVFAYMSNHTIVEILERAQ